MTKKIERNDLIHKPREIAEEICKSFVDAAFQNYDETEDFLNYAEVHVVDNNGLFVCEISINNECFDINTPDLSLAYYITSFLYKENILSYEDLMSLIREFVKEQEWDYEKMEETYNNLKYQ